MTIDLIAYLSDTLEQWDMLVAGVIHELEKAEHSNVRDYFSHMLIGMQLVRDELSAALASAIDAQITDNP